jgi:hypothetical protein
VRWKNSRLIPLQISGDSKFCSVQCEYYAVGIGHVVRRVVGGRKKKTLSP